MRQLALTFALVFSSLCLTTSHAHQSSAKSFGQVYAFNAKAWYNKCRRARHSHNVCYSNALRLQNQYRQRALTTGAGAGARARPGTRSYQYGAGARNRPGTRSYQQYRGAHGAGMGSGTTRRKPGSYGYTQPRNQYKKDYQATQRALQQSRDKLNRSQNRAYDSIRQQGSGSKRNYYQRRR